MARSIAIRGMAAVLVVPLAGCSFFGIDTRPGVEYATITERRPVKEPMYQRQVPGTNLVKRWPAQMGLAYGYAPWEKKQDAVMISQDANPGNAAGGPPPASAGTPGLPNRSPSARAQAKSVGSEVNLAANWAPRYEADPIKPKSHLRTPPVMRGVATGEESASRAGLIQPLTMTPPGRTTGAVTTANGDAASPPTDVSSNLPNVYDPSGAQTTPEDEVPAEP